MASSPLLLTILMFPASFAIKLGPYEAAMNEEVNIANELMEEFYEDVYDLKPESKDFLPDDYFDISQPASSANKESPTFTEQVKKALLKSAKMKKKSSGLQTSVVDPSPTDETEQKAVSVRPPSSRDPTFVLSRLLYHMAQLPSITP